jgi:hypothetical protein
MTTGRINQVAITESTHTHRGRVWQSAASCAQPNINQALANSMQQSTTGPNRLTRCHFAVNLRFLAAFDVTNGLCAW